MSVRIANGRKVSDDTADISWWVNEKILRARQLCDLIHFRARVALEAKMVKARFHFVLDHHQNERRIFVLSDRWSEPNIVASFLASIANDR